MTSKHQQKGSIVNRFLNSVEKIGNKLPDPSVLFFLMCIGLAIMTWVISLFNVSVKHPGTHQTIYIKNIISHDGFTMIMNDTIKNFSEFPALGLVLAVMIGIGVAENRILRQVNDFCCESRTTIFNFTDYYINWYFR